jgi:2,3-bisphosphoglycerate-dependent phosphoglycerate mutase
MIKNGTKILIVAHENLLRGIVKHLDKMTNKEIMSIELPNGIPFVYELDESLKPVMSMQFLGDKKSVKKPIKSVATQGNVKKLNKDQKKDWNQT